MKIISTNISEGGRFKKNRENFVRFDSTPRLLKVDVITGILKNPNINVYIQNIYLTRFNILKVLFNKKTYY